MGRAEAKATNRQALATSKDYNQQADQSFGADNAAITNYQKSVSDFAAANPYGIGGQFQQDQSRINADTSNAGTNSLNDAMRLNAQRTGQNDASYAPALAEAQRKAARDQATSEATADQKRIQQDAIYRQQATQFASMTPDMYARLYGTSVGGSTGALGPAATTAVGSKGFGQTFGDAFAGALGKTLGGPAPSGSPS